MYNVAVTFSGFPKYLDHTRRRFEHWNKLYPDVKFYFYIATWAATYDDTKFPLKDYYFSDYEYVHTDNSLMSIVEERWGKKEPFWAYCFKKSQELRRRQPVEFDGVLHTYPDVVVFKEHLDSIVDLLRNGYNNNAIYSILGSEEKKWNSLSTPHLGLTNPKFKFGSAAAFDKYSLLFDDMFINNSVEEKYKIFHVMHYLQMKNRGLDSLELFSSGSDKPIRDIVLPIRSSYEKDFKISKRRYPVSSKYLPGGDIFLNSYEKNIEILSNPKYIKENDED